MSRKIFALTLVLIILSTLTATGQTLDEILQKYYEARGGYEKLKAVNTTKTTGNQLVQGLEIPFTILQKRPNLMRIEATVQGQVIVKSYDGVSAWMINPLTGSTDPQILPEEQAKQIIEQADFDGHLFDYKEKGHTVELIGKEDMEGTEVYKLKVTLKNGDIRYDYLDAEYFLELKVGAKIKRQEMELEADTFVSDYKEVNGFMISHAMETKMGGNTVAQIVIKTVEFDVPIDDAVFKMPQKTEPTEPIEPPKQ